MYENDFHVIINDFKLYNKAYTYKSWYYKSRSHFYNNKFKLNIM